jgi:hypothetical protein
MLLLRIEHNNLYDFDKATQKLSVVQPSFHGPYNDVTFSRYDHYIYDPAKYREVTEEDFENRDVACTYFLEDGTRPYKRVDCEHCDRQYECRYNEKYFRI